MSRILKRPMFRIGGSTNEGIMSNVVPKRAGYQDPTDAASIEDNYVLDVNDPLYKDAMRRAAILSKFAGPGRSQSDRLAELLIKGGLKTVSETPRGGIFSTVSKAFQEPVSEYLKSSETEDAFQRQLKLAGITSAMQTQEAREKYAKELAIANQKLEQQEKELFFKTSGLGTKAPGIYETIKGFKTKGVPIEGGAVDIENKKPKTSDILKIPEGTVFYDVNGNFYKRTKEGPGYIRILTSGEAVPAPTVTKQPGFFEKAKEEGAAYDPRSWNKRRFYEELAKKNTTSTME